MIDIPTLHRLFSEVIAINQMVGNTAQPSQRTLNRQIYIIRSEVEELSAGIEDNNFKEIRDGIADVLFTVAGMYGRMGLELPTEIEQLDAYNAGWYAEQLLDECKAIEAMAWPAESEAQVKLCTVLREFLGYMIGHCFSIGDVHGLPVLHDLHAVIVSNYTKFDLDADTALLTKAKYAAIGVDTIYVAPTELQPKYYVTFSAADQTGTDGKSYPGGKWLKSLNFQEPVFPDVLAGPGPEIGISDVPPVSISEGE